MIGKDVYLENGAVHFSEDIWNWLEMVLDEGSFVEWENDQREPEKACLTGRAAICGQLAAIGVIAQRMLKESTAARDSERITRMVERATDEMLPVVLFFCMEKEKKQEETFPCLQRLKISQELRRHDWAGLLYIPVLTGAAMDGMTEELILPGDVIVAEPDTGNEELADCIATPGEMREKLGMLIRSCSFI